jgi:UDP-N-acetylglucosamine 2-epimerase (non-hydrolysing)/GDP/UDP-N,N'-diacetylbacillosamine 2-epimerase (hydrolysing)
MKVCVVTGSRADFGLLEYPIQGLKKDRQFDVSVLNIWNASYEEAFKSLEGLDRPDLLLVLGDRFEIMAVCTAAHLLRIPIAHIAGGDVTEGSYDDAMRDCISRMASVHFVTSSSAMARLTQLGCKNIHLVGSPGIDYIKHHNWKKEHPFGVPYVVISYQAETIDGTNEIDKIFASLPDKHKVFILPNKDAGSDAIEDAIKEYASLNENVNVYGFLPHDEFLNLLFWSDLFIGNSSAMLYEAPEMKLETVMIGKRQKGRTIPWGDGNASKRIVHALKYGAI